MSEKTRTGGREATRGVIAGSIALSVGNPGTLAPTGYTWTLLSDVARLESGHTPSRGKPEYWDGGIPWIGIRDATGNHGKTIFTTEQAVSALGVANSSTRILPAGTVCLSRTASVGYTVVMGVEMCTSQDFVNWVCGHNLAPQYLKYVLMLEQESIRRFAHGTTHQTMYYPEAKALTALLPDRKTQDAVVDVLGALDDKIAANTKLATTADSLVRTMYDDITAISNETTVVGGIVSNSRETVNPDLIRENVPYIGLEHVPRRLMWSSEAGSSDSVTSLKAQFRPGDILFGKLRPYFHKVMTAIESGVCSTDILVLRPNPEISGFALAALSSDAVIEQATASSEGTRMPRASWKDLAKIEVPWPGHDDAARFGQSVESLRSASIAVLTENRTLASIRDALLPQLMSGKLRVKDAEALVANAV